MATVAEIGLFVMSVGTVIAGILGDRIGRRNVLISRVALFGSMTFATGLIDGLWELGALRFLAGLGLGGAMPNAAAIAAEHTQLKKARIGHDADNRLHSLESLMTGLISRTNLPVIGWRTLFFVVGGLPVLVSLVLMVALPESRS